MHLKTKKRYATFVSAKFEKLNTKSTRIGMVVPCYSVGCFTISVDLGFLRTCTLKCGYWQCHTFLKRKCYDKKKKKSQIDLAAQSGAANEVVSRYGSASKEHLYPILVLTHGT